MNVRLYVPYFFIVFDAVSRVLAQTCEEDILKFTNAGDIRSTKSETQIGDTVTITCSTQCAWNWHSFYINSELVNSGMTSDKFNSSIKNEALNCPNCNLPNQVDCSDESQGPVQSSLNLTLLSEGDYYIQCVAYLFDLNSVNWPNRIISVYSKAIKIKAFNQQGVLTLSSSYGVNTAYTTSQVLSSHDSLMTILPFKTLSSTKTMSRLSKPSPSTMVTENLNQFPSTNSIMETNQIFKKTQINLLEPTANGNKDSCSPFNTSNPVLLSVVAVLSILCLILILLVVVILILTYTRKVNHENEFKSISLNQTKLSPNDCRHSRYVDFQVIPCKELSDGIDVP